MLSVWIALVVVGFTIKGVIWPAVIGSVSFLITGAFGAMGRDLRR